MDEALDASLMVKQGKTTKEIRAAIDRTYGR
jgi:hypothetical protein